MDKKHENLGKRGAANVESETREKVGKVVREIKRDLYDKGFKSDDVRPAIKRGLAGALDDA